MRRAVAVIPTIGEAPQLPTLVGQLLEEGIEKVLLVVNQPIEMLGEWVKSFLRSEWVPSSSVATLMHHGTIYDSWNMGLELARQADADALVLNDDVTLDRGAACKVLESLDHGFAIAGFDLYSRPADTPTGPRQTVSGSYRHGGVPGCAFAARPELCARVDPQFEWWYGDDDLFFATEAMGGSLCVRLGAGVTHTAETTAANHPWTYEARARDAVKFRDKWGDR